MTARKPKRASGRLSRSVLKKLIADLTERIGHQVEIAESIAKAAAPTRDTLMGAFPMLQVIELALNAHLHEMRQIQGLAKLMQDAAGQS